MTSGDGCSSHSRHPGSLTRVIDLRRVVLALLLDAGAGAGALLALSFAYDRALRLAVLLAFLPAGVVVARAIVGGDLGGRETAWFAPLAFVVAAYAGMAAGSFC
jgi:hypothetical protein